MEEKLQTALAELINLTLQGKDFILEQAPDVITQLLAWKFTMSFVWFGIGVLLLLATIPLSKCIMKAIKTFQTCPSHEEGLCTGKIVFCGAGCFLFPMVALVDLINFTWLQIWIAPKVYLLEYAAQLVG